MTNSELIPADILQRKAVVYVRQSSPSQVLTNLESQRLQYDLVNRDFSNAGGASGLRI
jgi:hypothetical protein